MVAWLLPAVLAVVPSPSGATSANPESGHVTGRVDVHLVRFLDEVSETDRARLGPLHDVRLRLEKGFVVLVRRGGDFAAILPIETRGEEGDSLQYFWYLEHPAFLWVIPGGRDRGVKVVADGADVRFDGFRLRWARGGRYGWLYFPDVPENRGVSFSVISGRSVDRIDPRDTRYWVELGAAAGGGGF